HQRRHAEECRWLRHGPAPRFDRTAARREDRRGKIDRSACAGRAGLRAKLSQVLRRLRIENLVLIREAELDLAPGLNAITGETGAGKTILAQSIGLLLGARGDATMIGPAGDEAYVEAELDADPTEALAELQPSDEPGLVL